MKALIVYQYLTLGGVEAVIRSRLEGLARYGVQASAWFLNDNGGRAMLEGLDADVQVGRLGGVERRLRARAYDVVSVIDTPGVLQDPGLAGCPVVVEAHTPYRENQRYLRKLDRSLAQAVLVPSRHQRAVVERQLTAELPIEVVPNPIAAPFLEPVRTFEPVPPQPIVAWIGRLDALKNWRGFLGIGQRLEAAGRRFEMWMVGGFPDPTAWRELYRAAKVRGLLDRLRWYPSCPPARMPRLLDAVRASGGVVISTSRGESFGMTVAEAMARACPVLVPDEPPFTEFVSAGETGLCYSIGDRRQAARKLADLLDQPNLRERLGRAARQVILAEFSPEGTLPAYVAALQAVAGGTTVAAITGRSVARPLQDLGSPPPAI